MDCEERKRRRLKQNYEQKARFLEWSNSLKDKPCTDCENSFDPVCMHWDHLPEYEKVAGISSMLSWCNKQRILDEIKKCELVCANCHALRHKRRLEDRRVAVTSD